MNREQADRFIYAARNALSRAGVDNRIQPLLELAPPDFMDFKSSVMAENLHWSDAELKADGEIYYRGAIVRAKA